jgi:hypothetical protein
VQCFLQVLQNASQGHVFEARYIVTSTVLQNASEGHVLETKNTTESKVSQYAAEGHMKDQHTFVPKNIFLSFSTGSHVLKDRHSPAQRTFNIFVYVGFHSEYAEG